MREVSDAEILAWKQGCTREAECWESCVNNAQAEIERMQREKTVAEGRDDAGVGTPSPGN